jgi:hypothetical protein
VQRFKKLKFRSHLQKLSAIEVLLNCFSNVDDNHVYLHYLKEYPQYCINLCYIHDIKLNKIIGYSFTDGLLNLQHIFVDNNNDCNNLNERLIT